MNCTIDFKLNLMYRYTESVATLWFWPKSLFVHSKHIDFRYFDIYLCLYLSMFVCLPDFWSFYSFLNFFFTKSSQLNLLLAQSLVYPEFTKLKLTLICSFSDNFVQNLPRYRHSKNQENIMIANDIISFIKLQNKIVPNYSFIFNFSLQNYIFLLPDSSNKVWTRLRYN